MNISFGSLENKICTTNIDINKNVIPISGWIINKKETKNKNKKDNTILKIWSLFFEISTPFKTAKKGFIKSLGCNVTKEKLIHLLEPLTSAPKKET